MAAEAVAVDVDKPQGSEGLHRTIGWLDAFWLASGVPALVLFSIGGVAAVVGTPSWLIWTLSVSFGVLQSFTYAEIAGLFPNKSGGASVYGAAAWLRYGKMIAPVSVWCNWLAWSPVLSIGSGLGAGYILHAVLPDTSSIRTWNTQLLDLGFIKSDLTLRVNATFIVGTLLLLTVFAIQHHGILRAARVQTIFGIAVLVPLLIVGIVPFLNGHVSSSNFKPFEPFKYAGGEFSAGGHWDMKGITIFAGGLFIAAWSAYAFETAICYTSEFRDPARDTSRAIFSAGAACLIIYILVPAAFQGALGVTGILAPGVSDGSAIGSTMASMVGGGRVIEDLLIIMLVIALMLAIMTSMAGSSRTLYQGSVDGWLPRYLAKVNKHGAPTRAMWTDLTFNLVLLMMSDYLFILAVSNCCYLVFNFLNLNAGWIHRMDNGHIKRPWRAPTVMLGIGVVLSYVNAWLLGAGAKSWGPNTLLTGVIAISLVIPAFAFRHWYQDRGKFPVDMLEALTPDGGALRAKRAGVLPYLTLIAGVLVVVVSNQIFKL